MIPVSSLPRRGMLRLRTPEKQKENWKDGLEVPVQKVEEEFSVSRFAECWSVLSNNWGHLRSFFRLAILPPGGVNLWIGLKIGTSFLRWEIYRWPSALAEAVMPRLKSLQAYVVQERALFKTLWGGSLIQPPLIVKALHEVLKRSMETLAETAAAGKNSIPESRSSARLASSETIAPSARRAFWPMAACAPASSEAPARRARLTCLLNTALMSECRTPDLSRETLFRRLRMKLPEALKVLTVQRGHP